MATKGIYIYGIVPNFYSTDMFRSLESSGVYVISFQNISAIVSDREGLHLESLDRESLGYLLVHHQKTIEDIMSKGFNMFIPMKLGTIVSNKAEVNKILTNGLDLIIETLKKIEYLTEIDLVVTWADFSTIIQEIANHSDIIALKEEILKSVETPSQINQVKVGMLIQEKLNAKNKKVELNILDCLAAFSLDIKTHEVMNDEMVTNSAFLLNGNKRDKFELAIDQLDQEYNGKLNFKLVGPLPCYSFYTFEVKALNPDAVLLAKNELGLGEETSDVEIKKAFLGKARLFHPDVHSENGDEENFNRINKAYHILLDYAMAAKQSSKKDVISLSNEIVNKNQILVKIKE